MRAQLKVLQYGVEDVYIRLCETASCPFGPGNTSFTFQFNVSDAYQGVSFNSKFVIINSAETSNVLGCVEVETTSILKGYVWFPLVFCVLGITLFVGFTYLITVYLNPWTGTKNVYLYTSNFGRDSRVNRLITPGLFDLIKYLQFALFITCLSLNYPGFLQPVVSTFGWSSLLFTSALLALNDGDLYDGLYTSNSTYGLENMAQVSQIAGPRYIWSSFIIWLLVISAGVLFISEVLAGATWLWRKYREDTFDLRTRNFSFLIGLMLRIFFNVFSFPLLTFSFFQCVLTSRTPSYLTALAVLVIAAWIGGASWLSWHLLRIKPRQAIYDDLPTMLRYGTLYNTYSDQGAKFFVVEFVTVFFRSLTVGAIQASGLAQIILLAVIELFYFFCILIIKPFEPETSMNLISCLFSILRFILVFLSLPFLSSLETDASSRQWLGYVILIFHGIVILLYLMHGVQVVIEVVLRYKGIVADEMTGAIFSLKQLSRRRRDAESIPMQDTKYHPTTLNTTSHKSSSFEGSALLADELPGHKRSLRVATGEAGQLTGPNRESVLEDMYMTSPHSDFSFFGNQRDSDGYYRKPRRKSSFDRANLTQALIDGEHGDGDNAEHEAIRAGLMSPPPAGVDYAVRESDIYYTKRAKPRRKKKRTSGDGEITDPDGPYESDFNRMSDYGGAMGELQSSGGVLITSKHRSRNPNSLVGLLDAEPAAPTDSDFDALQSTPRVDGGGGGGGFFGWFKAKKDAFFSSGYKEPSIEPKGFEVLRRGPIRAPKMSSETGDSSESESEFEPEPEPEPEIRSPEQTHARMNVVNSAAESRSLIRDNIPSNLALEEPRPSNSPEPPPRSPLRTSGLIQNQHHRYNPRQSIVESSAGTFIFPTSPSTAPGTLSNPSPRLSQYFGEGSSSSPSSSPLQGGVGAHHHRQSSSLQNEVSLLSPKTPEQ